MREWKKSSDNEIQQIFDDRKTWNLDGNNNSDNGRQAETNKTNINLQIKQLQPMLDAIKKRLVSFTDTSNESDENFFPDTAADSYKNYVEPSDSIKEIKCKMEICKSEWTNRGVGVKPLPPALKP